MKIWYDAGTGKHIRYGTAIAKRLRKLGHEVVLTTRRHPDTLSLAKFLGEQPIVVGKYAPASKTVKLKESLKRQLLLFPDHYFLMPILQSGSEFLPVLNPQKV